jgi:tRNA dimethylallyltransferase
MSGDARRRAVLIAGPTASGKSALGLARARATGGVIVNADAMQVYSTLRVLTARPSEAEVARGPHRLYGVVDPWVRYSTGDWFGAARKIVENEGEGPLIFVGGTGLYFEALTNGIANIPAVPAEIVDRVAAEVAPLDAAARRELLTERDPEVAQRIAVADPQRVIRALSVLEATGRSLASFQDAGQRGLLDDFEVERIVLNPNREVLRERIARRFEVMLEGGAVEEVEALLALGLDPSLPAMKAIGVREIGDWLAGRISRETAIDLAVTATRQFAKRQRTWFRNRMADWTWIDPLAG